ncbi:MAG: hypothetical protein FJ211_02820 [Ignavibacteria bacterium]|nr:hypothetical protein [Ignavibacteria bacterium]
MTLTRLRLAILVALAGMILPLHASAEPRVWTQLCGFIKNVGQWPSEVLYAVRTNQGVVWITRTGVVTDKYALHHSAGVRKGLVEREYFYDINPVAKRLETGRMSTIAFHLGANHSAWFSAPVYELVVVQEVVKGADFHYSVSDNAVSREIVYKDAYVPGTLRAEHIRSETQPRSEAMATTPVTSVVFGSFVGGSGPDNVVGVEYLTNGQIVVAGNSPEISFPNATGGYQTTIKGTSDGFVARLDRKLEKFLSYTYFGGSGDDRIVALTADNVNNIYVTGETTSTDLPITSGASGQLSKGGIDAFIAKFDSTLTKLIVSGYHGGNKDDKATAIAVDQNGLIFVCGYTSSTSGMPVTFPVTITRRDWRGRTYTEPGGGANQGLIDGFVCFFSANGSIQQSRYFGREGNEFFRAMCLDRSNGVYITGSTTSPNFETAPSAGFFSSGRLPYDRTFNGGTTDAFVLKLNNELALAKSDDGTYSTFFGGDGEDEGRGIYVDDLGRAHFVGNTTSKNLETVGTLITQRIGDQDIFYGVLPDDGRTLNGATYFGGTGKDEVVGMNYDPLANSAVLVGTTQSNDFPVMGEGARSERAGNSDGFISVLNTSTNKYTTLIGGENEDTVRVAVVDQVSDLYIAGTTTSTNFPTNPAGAITTVESGLSGFVSKYAFGTLELTTPTGGETWCVGANRPISWAALGVPDTMKFAIEISQAGSNKWTEISKAAVGRSLNWKVANLPTGQYVIRVTTSRGHGSLLTTPFTISNPPSITQQPKDASACDGGKITLRVGAEGAGLKYQWRRNGTNVPGATADSLLIPSLDATTIGKYDVVITGTCTPNATSAQANVVFGTPIVITQQPTPVTVELDRSFALSVAATGSSLSYQWKKDGSLIQGATTATYSVEKASAADNGSYVCDITGGCGTVSTAPVSVVVKDPTSVDGHEEVLANIAVTGAMPVQDVLYARIATTSGGEARAEIVDLQGRTVLHQNIGFLSEGVVDIQLPLNALAPGVYTLRVHVGKVAASASVLIK